MGSPLHVVAAVLRDPQGRVLLARRPEGKAHAGLWEFPGGKVEAGETALAALRRELREELGVELRHAEPLIRVPVAAPDTSPATAPAAALPPPRLHLDTWHVLAFDGAPTAHEHPALAWVALADLDAYPMPPADRPVVAALRVPDRVLITPEPGAGPEAEATFVAGVEAALAAGVRRIQLRLRADDPERVDRLAVALAARGRPVGAGLWVHGLENAALARRARLGLHLRARELAGASTPAVAALLREHRSAGLPLSAACHDRAELALAETLGVDDALLGPVHATATHPGQPGLGWGGFEALRGTTALPVYALGGLGPADLPKARYHGAQGVAGIRAFWPG